MKPSDQGVKISENERRKLNAYIRDNDARVRIGAEVILSLASGKTCKEVAKERGVTTECIYNWRTRYKTRGIREVMRAASRSGYKKAEVFMFVPDDSLESTLLNSNRLLGA